VEVSQKRGVKVLEQGLSMSLAAVENVRPARSLPGPQFCPPSSSTSAWSVSPLSLADMAPRSFQESGAILSTACDFTLPDLDPDLFQRYSPQANDLSSLPVDSRSK
ncbi:hypothetical protein NDU88_000003, partial [Pleurodeles waltl]